MQTSNRFFDDMARMANGAVSAVTGMKSDGEDLIKRQLERLLADMDMVTREEFETVKAMAAKARAEQETLQARVAELESKLAAKKTASKASAKTSSTKKSG